MCWDGWSDGGRGRDADERASERLSCAEPLILLLLLDYLWQKIRLDRLQINQAVGCLLADYFWRYVAPVKLLPLLSPKLSKQWPPVASQTDDVHFAPLPKQHLNNICNVSVFLSFFFLLSLFFHAPHGEGEEQSWYSQLSMEMGAWCGLWDLGVVLPVLLSQLSTDSIKKQPPSQLSYQQKKQGKFFCDQTPVRLKDVNF